MGVINVISSSLPALRDRFATLEQFLPLEVVAGSRPATAFAGFALLMLSVNLWRRKQVAWLLTMLALAASATILSGPISINNINAAGRPIRHGRGIAGAYGSSARR